MKKDTSWGTVAGWYDDLLEGEDTFQRKVILPNLTRLMNLKEGDIVADIACGNGFFAGEFARQGARVIGTDISPELIVSAKKQHSKSGSQIDFFVSATDDPAKFAAGFSAANKILKNSADKKAVCDKAVCILAIQNIKDVKILFENCRSILAPGGSLYIVMNHPAYRIAGASSWGFDESSGKQYRRIDQYLSEMKTEIVMNPGAHAAAIKTISFHRPLQYYFKLLQASGFSVSRLEEWISHRHSQAGPRQKEEDRVRGEFPLFLFLEAKRV